MNKYIRAALQTAAQACAVSWEPHSCLSDKCVAFYISV